MSNENFKKMSKKAQIKNKDCKCRVSKISNMQIVDIVQASKDGLTNNQSVNMYITEETTRIKEGGTSEVESILPGNEIQNATVDVTGSDEIKTTADTKTVQNSTDETENRKNTPDTVETTERHITSDGVANVAKDIKEINGIFAKKVSLISNHIKFLEEKNLNDNESLNSEDTNDHLLQKGFIKDGESVSKAHINSVKSDSSKIEENTQEIGYSEKPEKNMSFATSSSEDELQSEDGKSFRNNNSRSYNNYVSSYDSKQEENVVPSTDQTDITGEIKTKPSITRVSNSTLVKVTHQDNHSQSRVPRLLYESSGDIPLNETETESGIKEREDIFEKYRKDHREKPSDKKRVLITRHHILTAGHCLPRSVPRFLQYTNYYIAWAGNSDSQYIDDKITRRQEISDTNFKSGEQIRICDHWYKHPQQDSMRFINDIGLIRCVLAFNPIPNVVEMVPIAPNFPFQKDTQIEMYGWGVINNHNDRSLRLKKYTTFIQPPSACDNLYINITPTHHICTYSNTDQSYKGDSGAPALYKIRNPKKKYDREQNNKNEETRQCSSFPLHLDNLNKEIKDRWSNKNSTLVNIDDIECYVNKNYTHACLTDTDKYFPLNSTEKNSADSKSRRSDLKYINDNLSSKEYFLRNSKVKNSAGSQPEGNTLSCGYNHFTIAPTAQYSHYACLDSSICFMSVNKQMCANTKPLCCTKNINPIRCIKNETLRHPKGTGSYRTGSDGLELFLHGNYVCDLNETIESDVEEDGQKVIVGITSFHLDSFVVLTNITDEYYQFVYNAVNMALPITAGDRR